MNSSEFLTKNAQQYPDVFAVKTEYGHLTYAELDEQVNLLGNGLLTRGIKRADKVMLFMPNTVEFVISYFAIQRIGAIVVPVNINSNLSEVEVFIKYSNPHAIIAHHLIFNAVRNLDSDILKIKTSKANLYWESFLEITFTASADKIDCLVNEDDPASLLFTSSTKDIPRSALFNYRSALTIAHMICAEMKIKQSSRVLLMNHPNHSTSFQLFLIASMISGSTLVFRTRFTPELLIEAVESEQITHFFGRIEVYLLTAIKLQNKQANLSSVEFWIYDDEPIKSEEKEFIKKQFETDHFVSINQLTEDDDY